MEGVTSPPTKTNSPRLLVSFRIGLSAILISIVLIIAIVGISITYLRFSKALLYLSNHLMAAKSDLIDLKLLGLIQPITSTSILSMHMITTKIVDPDDFNEIHHYTTDLLSALPQVDTIIWADAQGNYVISQHFAPRSILITDYNHRQDVITNQFPDTTHPTIPQAFLQQQLHYNPSTRPWYQLAQQAPGAQWTDAHHLYWSGEPGVTCSIAVYQNQQFKGIFAIELRLGSLSNFLAKHRISKDEIAFIIDQQGYIKAFQNPSALNTASNNNPSFGMTIDHINNPTAAAAFHHFQQTHLNRFNYRYRGKRYLANFTAIPQFARYQWYVGTIVPEKYMIKNLEWYNYLNLFTILLMTLIGLRVFSTFANRVSKPINYLAHELEAIKFFHIEPKPLINTRIKEVHTISHAIESMKIGLQSFRRYVPEKLIRQLMETGVAAKIGGNYCDVALFFSDIINFTALAERVEPEKIMQHMCTYLSEMTRIISAYNGTIDKYMGDSIMAFWGAPLPDKNSIEHACITALKCQERLTALNVTWKQTSNITFPTCIGIHFGKVIIGNVGASTRLNYTAIGDAVNTASRLDHLNKFYGTKILISEHVYQQAQHRFLCRILDRITVKGSSKPLSIYELIGEKSHALPTSLLEFCEYYTQGFSAYQQRDWNKALDIFKKVLQLYPNDIATKIMIGRCYRFKAKPPPPDWRGTWVYTSKS